MRFRRSANFTLEKFTSSAVSAEAVKDIRRMKGRWKIAEGLSLLPHLVAEVADVDRAVCPMTAPEFQKADLRRRIEENPAGNPGIQSFINHPRRGDAIRRRIEIYAWQSEYIGAKADEVRMPVITNDGKRDMEGLVSEVEEHLGLA